MTKSRTFAASLVAVLALAVGCKMPEGETAAVSTAPAEAATVSASPPEAPAAAETSESQPAAAEPAPAPAPSTTAEVVEDVVSLTSAGGCVIPSDQVLSVGVYRVGADIEPGEWAVDSDYWERQDADQEIIDNAFIPDSATPLWVVVQPTDGYLVVR